MAGATERTYECKGGVRTLLVSMPFFSIRTPSLQLGLLSAIGKANGFDVRTLHLNLDLAAHIGREAYEALCQHRGVEFGNWVFSKAAFRDLAPDAESKLPQEMLEGADLSADLNMDASALRTMRDETAPRFIEYAMEAADWTNVDIVGFTCTFQQTTASLALARRLKEKFPRILTLFGGASLESNMGREIVRAFPWVDLAIDGEADLAFPALLARIADRRPLDDVPGLVCRAHGASRARPEAIDLDALPVPDYREFFARAEALGLVGSEEASAICIPFEGSRGCWWGRKHHCTFCGLNGDTMGFRQKTPQRMLAELEELSARYGALRFTAVDNIMPLNFISELMPALRSGKRNYDLFFEVKANLTSDQVKLLSEAGVKFIQPGIESLSSRVLRLMGKGVRAIQNVNLIRWALAYGVDVTWNILYGFPGEDAEDYRVQADLAPHLVHLQPPVGIDRIWLERFSPLYFDRQRFPVETLTPERSLSWVYPDNVALSEIAYFFDHRFPNELPGNVYEPLHETIGVWRDAWTQERRPWLVYRDVAGLLHIEDGRDPRAPRIYVFDFPLADIYRGVSIRPTTATRLKDDLGLPWDAEEIASSLDLLAARGLVMRDEELFLALAIPASADRATAESDRTTT